MPINQHVDGRTRHYGTFYDLDPADRADTAAGDQPGSGKDDSTDHRPLLLVWGNCQAEAIRVLLSGSPTLPARAVRIPPVFELTESDLGHLGRLAARARMLIAQPVKDNYRGLPLGTAQVAALLPAGGTVLRWPVLRYAAYHPFQAIIRDPQEESRDPPVVPYHDLRTLVSARTGVDTLTVDIPASACRGVAEASLAELRRRERSHCDIPISDVFDHPRWGDMHTINHPGNRVLVELARRIQLALDAPADAVDPGRELLGDVRAPVPAAALAALGLPGSGSASWRLGGRTISAAEVHRAQWHWYRNNPQVVDAGYDRHRETLNLLGLL